MGAGCRKEKGCGADVGKQRRWCNCCVGGMCSGAYKESLSVEREGCKKIFYV